MPYVRAKEVISPKSRWKLIAVLEDRGPGNIAYPLGEWDGEPRIGVRWNGDDEQPIGNPQSRGLPTWTMLDRDLYLPIMQDLPEEMQMLARTLLKIDTYPVIEMKVARHPSENRTLMKRVSGQDTYKDCPPGSRLFANNDLGTFYRAVCREIMKHVEDGSRVVFHDTKLGDDHRAC